MDTTSPLIAGHPDEDAEQALLQLDLLDDVDPNVRLQAALDLGRRQVATAAQTLVDRLGTEREFLVREALTWAVLRIADDAMPFVHQALSSGRWLARVQAAHVVGKLGRRTDAGRLVALIGDEVDAVAARAYQAAARTGDPVVVPALVTQLSRGGPEHQDTLTRALAAFGEAAVPALVDALRTGPGPGARRHAADILGLLGSPPADRAALPLAEALDDGDREVRLAALNALGQLRLPFADRTVDRATGSADPLLRHLARRLADRRSTGAPATRLRPSTTRPVTPTVTTDPDGDTPCGMIATAPGVLVELTCETTVVAAGRTFRELGRLLADLAAATPDAGAEDLPDVRLPRAPHGGRPVATVDGETLRDLLVAVSSASGERIGVGRVARLPGRTVSHLARTRSGLPPQLGALVGVDGGRAAEELATPIARHVATAAPRYLSRDDIPADVLATVRTRAEELARAQGTPEAIRPRVVAGRAERFVHDTVLLEQVSVLDAGQTIAGLLYGTGVHLTGFARLEVGSGRRSGAAPGL
ncbi:MAG: hypothetical protein GXX79_07495 [Actinomycetales bacterium]|nr:hypothetical protein [Actinomycetales bacterium]